MLLILAGGALIFSTVADYTTPLIRRKVSADRWQSVTRGGVRFAGWSIAPLTAARLLIQVPNLTTQSVRPPGLSKIGNRVRYRGEGGWTILGVERLLTHRHLWFCAADGPEFWRDRPSIWPTCGVEPDVLEWQIALPLAKLGWHQDRLGRLKRLKQRFFHS